MKAKTKFFSVLFGLLLLIPCFLILTACNNPKKTTDDEDVTLKDNEITINVSNKVYDGQAIAVTATATSGVSPTIVYKLAGADDSAYTPEAPKNVGEYVVGAGVEANDEYKQAYKTQQFSITPKEVTIAWTAPANLVYDGQIKEPTVNITSGLLQGDSCDVQKVLTDGNDNVNVGTFTFTATGLSNTNYKLPTTVESEEYTIAPQLVSGQNVEFQYNGETVQVASLSVIETGLTIELTFDSEDVGASVVSWVFKSNEVVTDNFALDTLTCTAEIVQKELTPVWTAPFLKYNTHEKVPTCTLSGVVQGEECNVEIQLVPGGDNVSVAGTFRYQATLTGADHDNYCIVDVESPEYTIVAPDILELNSPMANYSVPAGEIVMFGAQVASDGTYEIILNGFRSNVYQYVQFVQNDQNTGIHPVANVKKGFHAYENLNNVTYNYICFEAEANKQYMLMIDQTGASAVTNGFIELIPHDHYYSFYEDLCYCDHFTGTTLAVGTAQNNLSGDVGSKLSFRFYAQEGHYYYITQSLLGTTGYDVRFGTPDGGEDQAFDQGFVNAFGASNAVKATDDAWVYIYYTAPVAFANGSITIHDDVDVYGFRNGTYVGKTVGIDEVVEIPNLASGETMFLRFAVNNGEKYGYTKYDNLSSTSGEIEFYVKESSTWVEQTNITWGTGNERTLDNVADDGYCYVIITSDGNCAGQISILLGPTELM